MIRWTWFVESTDVKSEGGIWSSNMDCAIVFEYSGELSSLNFDSENRTSQKKFVNTTGYLF